MTRLPSSIIDAHHHLWDLDKLHYPWLAAKGVKRFFGDPSSIQKNYLPSDFTQDHQTIHVIKSVFIEVGVEADFEYEEALRAQEFSRETEGVNHRKIANAVVAHAKLENASLSQEIDRLKSLPNLRGIRQIVGRSPEEDKKTGTNNLIENKYWRGGLELLTKQGLSFDLQLIPDQMSAVFRILEQLPELQVALCHCGSPWYGADHWKRNLWVEGISALASLPNVHCKLSGLSMFFNQLEQKEITPIAAHLLNSFTSDRLMFGSNFPVDRLHNNYQQILLAYLTSLESADSEISEKELVKIFGTNTESFYRI